MPQIENQETINTKYQDKLKAKEQAITDLKTQNSQLEEQYLAARLKNLQDFGEYYTAKKALKSELAENVNEAVQEIQKLEQKLIALNRKKLAMQEQLKQAELKNTQLELKALDREPPTQPVFNLNWVLVFSLGAIFLLIKGEEND